MEGKGRAGNQTEAAKVQKQVRQSDNSAGQLPSMVTERLMRKREAAVQATD